MPESGLWPPESTQAARDLEEEASLLQLGDLLDFNALAMYLLDLYCAFFLDA